MHFGSVGVASEEPADVESMIGRGHHRAIGKLPASDNKDFKSRAILETAVDFGCGLEKRVHVKSEQCLTVIWVSECVVEQVCEGLNMRFE